MTPHEIEAAFAQAVADAGLGLWSIPADGKLHRFKVPADKGRQLTGWAVLHGDGLPAGVAGDWRTGERVTWKGAGEAAKLSRADRRELAELRRKRKAALADIQGRAAAKAAALYERLPPAPADHPYLTRKKIAAGPCKVTSGGALMVLVRDADTTKAISLQFIQPNGEKRFLTGGRTARGCCFLTPITAAPVVIAEGYATGQAIQVSMSVEVTVVVAFNAGNLLPVAKVLRARYPNREVIIAADNDENTEGNPGVSKATEAAEAIGARLVAPAGPGDFNDVYVDHGAEAVKAMFMPDTPKMPDNVVQLFPTPDEAVARLAKLEEWEYELKRKAEAKRLGVRASALDNKVKAARGDEDDTGTRQGRALELPEPDLWNEPVDGDALLDGLRAAIERYVVLPPHTSAAIALWVVHTYAIDETHHTPRLLFASPEMRCGKTTALNVLRRLVLRALQAANISTAAVYRTVEAMKPTLLVDEADTFLAKSDELRGVVNSGHERSGAVIKCEGENSEPRIFATFAATAIAGIGKMPGTIEDRSIIIRMRRRKPSEDIKRLRGDRAPELDDLASMAARWVADHRIALQNVDVDPPAVLSDRAADGWRPLIGIADLCGGDWPEIARQAAVALSGYPDDDESIKIMLLRDIRSIFDAGGQDKIPSEALVSDLHEMEERPWNEFGRAQ